MAGDLEALRDVVTRYGREVLLVATVAARRTGRPPMDATVEAFVALFRSPGAPDVRRHLLLHVGAAQPQQRISARERQQVVAQLIP